MGFIERLELADRVIEMLSSGKLPHPDSFIFNARFELRAITDSEMFSRVGDDAMKAASRPSGEIRLGREGALPVVSILYEPPKDAEQAAVFGKGKAVLLGSGVQRRCFAPVLSRWTRRLASVFRTPNRFGSLSCRVGNDDPRVILRATNAQQNGQSEHNVAPMRVPRIISRMRLVDNDLDAESTHVPRVHHARFPTLRA